MEHNGRKNDKYFRYFGFNSYKLVASFLLLVFITIFAIINPDFLFKMPWWVYAIATAYFAIFPLKDMFSRFNKTLFKGKQFDKNYEPNLNLTDEEFKKIKRKFDLGALRSIIFWLCFMAVPGTLYMCKIIGPEWILFFFAMSNFCVYFAIFFWCPFQKILVKPHCCMDCRIFNWDSFFSFSFLIFLNSIYGYILFGLGLISLIQWEITYYKHPRRFFISSNEKLSCANCDMEHCKNYKSCKEK